MRLVFCADPFQTRRVDEAYQSEFDAARQLPLETALINFEELVYADNPVTAVARVPLSETPTTGVYRGWMLTVSQYEQLYEALRERGVELINSPEAYAICHHLPLSYSLIAAYTPKTVWSAFGDFSTILLPELLRPFGESPMIVKDYVKSRKHEWAEACFIPSASDTTAAARVVETFLKRQGSDLTGGLVFREFVEFEPLTIHSQSGMPLTREFRLVFLDGTPIVVSRYWDEGDYAGQPPPLEQFTAIAHTIPSRFFTMDVARTKTGEWMIVELGDAQVAELPPETNPADFYAALAQRVC